MDQPLDQFSEFLVGSFEVGLITGDISLTTDPDYTKPTVPADCEDAVADYNDQIDDLAEELAKTIDLINFLPTALCAQFDADVQVLLAENIGAIDTPA